MTIQQKFMDDLDYSDSETETTVDDDIELNSNLSQTEYRNNKRIKFNQDENEYEDEERDEWNDKMDDDEEDEDDLDDEVRYQKLSPGLKQNIIQEYYPELRFKDVKEIQHLIQVTRDENGVIVDERHRTTPILTKFEMTRILGERAKQLQQGAASFLPGMEDVIDAYFIAQEELKLKVLPFIVERPLPLGQSEYWPLAELEIL